MEQWLSEEEAGKIVRYSYSIKEELFQKKSEFQDVKVVDTHAYGKMLVLDNFVMLTENDEFVYHELISHIPVCYHRYPRKVVVIGGGDGGTVRELLKHPEIEQIELCEIDELVVEVSKKYFPQVACDLDDPRVNVRIGDGFAYMQSMQADADIIIVDSTDPIGPGEGLFTGDFYKSVARALKPGGLMVAQSESPWGNGQILRKIYNNMRTGFSCVKPYIGSIPTYPRGLWSWTLAAQEELSKEQFDKKRFAKVASGLRYLTEEGTDAVFVLPPFYRQKLGLSL